MIRKDISRFSHCDKKARRTQQAQMTECEQWGLTSKNQESEHRLSSVFHCLGGKKKENKKECLHFGPISQLVLAFWELCVLFF